MKTYTHKQLEKIISDVIEATMMGTGEYFIKDTVVRDRDTKKILIKAELYKKKDAKGLMARIVDNLDAKGIKYSFD